MRYLIDGYNLIYAIAPLGAHLRPHALERARINLLDRLWRLHGDGSASVTVVFDGGKANKRGIGKGSSYHGIHILYAVGQEADDVIEELVRQETMPAQLTVVSGDHRLREAARRRGCPCMECLDYLERIGQRPAPSIPADAVSKPEALSAEETQRWLEEFGDLEKDPNLKEWFDLDRMPDVDD